MEVRASLGVRMGGQGGGEDKGGGEREGEPSIYLPRGMLAELVRELAGRAERMMEQYAWCGVRAG